MYQYGTTQLAHTLPRTVRVSDFVCVRVCLCAHTYILIFCSFFFNFFSFFFAVGFGVFVLLLSCCCCRVVVVVLLLCFVVFLCVCFVCLFVDLLFICWFLFCFFIVLFLLYRGGFHVGFLFYDVVFDLCWLFY